MHLLSLACGAPSLLADKTSSLVPLFEQQQHQHPMGFHGVQTSLDHFTNGWFVLSLLMGLVVAAICAAAIAWHPRRSGRDDPVEDIEQRNTLIVLALVGAVVSELVRVDTAMALVIFGIGGLIRFRTVFDNPKITGKAIMVVVIGLACGLGELAMAVFFTVFAWVLIFWLDSTIGFRLRLKLPSKCDAREVQLVATELVAKAGGRIASAQCYEHKRQVVIIGKVPSKADPGKFHAALLQRLPQADDIEIDLKTG